MIFKYSYNTIDSNETEISDEVCSKIIEEVHNLIKLKSIYIVDYNTSWIDSDHRLCIQMEFCEYSLKNIVDLKNTLNSSLNAINYYISSELFREILECVQYLHSREPPIIHRDLKPHNILLKYNNSNGRFVKLCDFGLSVEHKIISYSKIQKSMTHTRGAGTLDYMAPEVRQGRNYNTYADIYSIGMIGEIMFDEFDKL